MRVIILLWHESATCCWCEKSRECVTVSFSDGFLNEVPMCWKCLETAVRVRSKQQPESTPPEPAKKKDKERIPVETQ